MKKLSLLACLAVLLCFAVLPSCEKNNGPTSKGIVKECNDLLYQLGEDSVVTYIRTGYYELNDSPARCELKRLEAAGLITYQVERFAWWDKTETYKKEIAKYDWYYGPTYKTVKKVSYDYNEHFMVDVQLADEGKKWIVKGEPIMKPVVDKDLLQPDSDLSSFPENQIDCVESWPEVPNPYLKPEPELEVKPEPEPKTEPKPQPKMEAEPEPQPEAELDPQSEEEDLTVPQVTVGDQCKAFEQAKAKEDSQFVCLFAYKNRAIKARNIQISNTSEFPTAQAEVIFEIYNVSTAGRAIKKTIEGTRSSLPVTLNYYIDKGWVLDRDR